MPDQYDDNLFEESKMTFGEHLDELRKALIKAVGALLVGFVIGLLVGNWVVRSIQVPVKAALEDFYANKAMEEWKEEQENLGNKLPESDEEIEKLFIGEELYSEQVFLDPADVVRELKNHDSKAYAALDAPAEQKSVVPSKEALIPVFLWRSLARHPRAGMTTLNAQEAFMIYIKAALVFGAVISSPVIFWSIWSFVESGLYPHEKKYVHVFMPISISLFLGGASMAFFLVFQYVLKFLFSFNAWLGLDPDLRISEWMGFVLFLPIGFGVAFQLPLVMLFIERIGLITVEIYRQKWRMAVLVIAIISMLLTPADPMSMLLMATPLTVLYFAGIAFCQFMPRSRNPFSDPIE